MSGSRSRKFFGCSRDALQGLPRPRQGRSRDPCKTDMQVGEALSFSVQALRQNPVRSLLTGLGMVIGTASVILVVTISLTSQNYILEQIEGVGSNMVFASYAVGTQQSTAEVNADFIKIADVQAIREELSGRIVAATGISTNYDAMFINGKEERLLVI